MLQTINLQEDDPKSPSMSRSIVARPRREKLKYRTQSTGDRMTQSMYADPNASARVSPSGSGVSFFVDLVKVFIYLWLIFKQKM
jgi:hypothetical protein